MRDIVILITLLIFMVFPLASIASEALTIPGEINNNSQTHMRGIGPETQVESYKDDNNLAENHMDKEATVAGIVKQVQNLRIIAYPVIDVPAE